MAAQRRLTVASNPNAIIESKQSFLDIPGCEFTRTQLIISEELSFDEWARLGGILRTIGGAVNFWIGDWIRFGERKWGEMYAQAIETTGLDYQTLADAVYVAKHVHFSLRNENLSFSHHRAVAPLESAEEQREWLNKAEDEQIPYRELRRLIERQQRAQNFKLVNSVLEKLWERMQDGCWTAEALGKCSECGNSMFGLDVEEIKLYQQQMVGMGRAEWRKQGGRKDGQKGEMVMLCVPVGTPAGSDMSSGYRPRVEWGEDEEHF